MTGTATEYLWIGLGAFVLFVVLLAAALGLSLYSSIAMVR